MVNIDLAIRLYYIYSYFGILVNKKIVLFLLVPRDEEKHFPPLAWYTSIGTVNNDFPYTGLNTEKCVGTANAFINYGRCQLQKFVINEYNDIFGAFIITANVENLVYGFII